MLPEEKATRQAGMYFCEVCGAPQKDPYWFVVSEDRELETLRIDRWETIAAARPGVRHLCSAAHVERLVCHWMMTSSLDYRITEPICDQLVATEPLCTPSFEGGGPPISHSGLPDSRHRSDVLKSLLQAVDIALERSQFEPDGEDEGVFDA